ncbi:hypothetical protein QVD17_13054 [Tagetes erecta]|uniref:F-box domain-containing protein n=1 Tax=Tagetes erecta TaxID=13708 RepID=A0AAD8KWC4_TARER|nr:hypothetical protein QVD17_13054 [Tagetes erecta]
MDRNIKRKGADSSKLNEDKVLDWTQLPNDAVIQIFTLLNNHDRANLSSTCKSCRSLGSSSCLWQSLDLRAHRCDGGLMQSLASRCSSLQKLRFRGSNNTDSIINIRAKNLKELSVDCCSRLNDQNITSIVSFHNFLESIQFGPDLCNGITSAAVVAIALSCTKLKKLRLSGIRDVNKEAIDALATHCPNLNEIGFIECETIDEVALGNVVSLRFLSVAGTTNSSEDDVQELAAKALPYFVLVDGDNINTNERRVEAVMQGGGVRLLLDLARSWKEGLQIVATQAIAHLVVNPAFAKSVTEVGGITILASLAKSMNRLVAEQAAGAFCSLASEEVQAGAIAEAGGIKILLDIIYKWPTEVDGVMQMALAALVNLTADDKCVIEVARVGGINALVTLARTSQHEGVQKQVVLSLGNVTVCEDRDTNDAALGQESGVIDALVLLVRSQYDAIRQEAAKALRYLLADLKNHKCIALAGGVEALVALAQSCSNASPSLQEMAAGALWRLSDSETNSLAIAREGGIAALITLAESQTTEVHKTAAMALYSLAAYPPNVLRIFEDGGVPVLINVCSSMSEMAQFMAALALVHMFHDGMDEYAMVGSSVEDSLMSFVFEKEKKLAFMQIENFMATFAMTHGFYAASSSSLAMLTQAAESALIVEVGELLCREFVNGRFLSMLRSQSPVLKTFGVFVLLQLTLPGGQYASYHVNLLKASGAPRVLRALAASVYAPVEAKIFARIVLRNLEHQQTESST